MAVVGAPVPRRLRRPALAVALAAALLATLTAGSCAPASSAQPQQTPHDDVSYEDIPTVNPSDDPHNRENVLPVPKGTSPRGVEFADPDTGYALFTSCVAGQACVVGLALTLDGGGSWVARDLPFNDAIDVDMHVGRGNVLIIKAAPDGYYVSRDTGRTFDKRPLTPPPAELQLAEPQYSVGCQDLAASGCPDVQPWVIGDDGTRRSLPSRPSGVHRFTGLTAAADGTLWLTAQADAIASPEPGATISVWSSADHGKTWQPQGTAHAIDPTTTVRPVVRPDGGDVWLVGARFAARRQPGSSSWVEATAMREVAEVFSAEVLPGGAVLIASNQGVWTVDTGQRVRDPGARLIFRLRRLDATTILGYPAQQSGDVWLCTVHDKSCEWTHVAVSAR
ncbi:hypothetical protein AB0M46_48735 [Dactylosporangium sp. NPDC051485]|uniref:hypothetical protein n=1 Tax=Dactylosporangium sp. NPDC051485 TaxID=3154846 RepID=UPI0034154392